MGGRKWSGNRPLFREKGSIDRLTYRSLAITSLVCGMSEKSLLLIGATGMIGGIVLRYALSETAIGAITSIGRRPTGLQDPKLHEIQHENLTDFSSVEPRLQGHDLALFCLGAYTGSISDAEFRKVTVDYTVALAEALYGASPGAAFCFLSGQGADSSEKRRAGATELPRPSSLSSTRNSPAALQLFVLVMMILLGLIRRATSPDGP